MLVRTGIEIAAYFVEGFCKTITETETKPVVIRVSLFAFMKVTISIWFDILNLMACARFERTNAERNR